MKPILRSLSALLLFLPISALAAAQITGTVTNRTTNRPAAGDQVTLLQQGMQQVAEARTDAKGQFSLNAPAGGPFLLRVTHDLAAYYASASAGQPVNVDVYSVGAHVAGVTTLVLMLRAQTDAGGANLNVTEDFVVKNASTPPMTQYSKAPFDLYLPEGAVVEATAAKGPNGMPTAEELTPQSEKGLYSVMFPIKPGETQIEIAYHLPYTGNLKLNMKMAGQTDMFAVSLPKSMTFTPGPDGRFIPANGDLSATTYLARGVKPGQSIGFSISGSGQLPRDTQGSDQGGQPGAAAGGGDASAGAPVDNAPGKGLGNPLDPNGTREPVSTKYKWWILGGLGLLLVAAAGVLLRKPAVAPVVGAAASQEVVKPVVGARAAASSLPVAATTPAGQQAQLLQVLKEELFGLETDRLQGHVSEDEYAQSKAAIELILRRALRHGATAGSVAPADATV
jgi:hypothetical protein